MQHPFLFVQDCSSETSEKVLVDKLNRFFFCERDLTWSLCISPLTSCHINFRR